jgi:multidrug efflux pump subunit AcrA (membrane-fusion protein)
MSQQAGLFRQQVLLLQHEPSERGTVISQSHSLKWFSLALALLFLGLLYLLLLTSYKETIQARGVLQAAGSIQTVTAPADLRVEKILVAQGQQVSEGQALAILSRRLFDQQGRPYSWMESQQLQQQQALLQNELRLTEQFKSAEQQQLQSQLQARHKLLEAMHRDQQLAREQLSLSQQQLDAMAALLEQASVSRADYRRQRLAHLEVARQFNEQSRGIEQLQQEILQLEDKQQTLQLEQDLLQLQGQGQIEELAFKRARLSQQDSLTLVAEQDGVVTGVAVAAGEALRANQPLMQIHEHGSGLQAVAYVPSSVVGKLVPGQQLLLSFDAFNYMDYGRYAARIETISRFPIDPRQQLVPVPGVNEPVFRLTASLEQHYVEGPDIYPLQSGLLLSADFVTAELTLIGFILKPVLELRGRLG